MTELSIQPELINHHLGSHTCDSDKETIEAHHQEALLERRNSVEDKDIKRMQNHLSGVAPADSVADAQKFLDQMRTKFKLWKDLDDFVEQLEKIDADSKVQQGKLIVKPSEVDPRRYKSSSK